MPIHAEDAAHLATMLDPHDVARCRAIVRAAAQAGNARAQRRGLFDALLPLLDADGWIWAFSGTDVEKLHPVNLEAQYSHRPSIASSMAYFRRVMGVRREKGRSPVPPENARLHELVLAGRPFTWTNVELVGADVWHTDREIRAFTQEFGFDDCLYTIVPRRASGGVTFFCGVMIGRRTGKPDFTQREIALSHLAFTTLEASTEEGTRARYYPVVAALTPALRVVLLMLSVGYGIKQVALGTGNEAESVRKQVKMVARAVLGSYSSRKLRAELGHRHGEEVEEQVQRADRRN